MSHIYLSNIIKFKKEKFIGIFIIVILIKPLQHNMSRDILRFTIP